MVKFTISTTINKTPELIAQALNDPKNMKHWTTGLEKFKVVKGTPEKVGATAHLYFNERGQEYILEDKLIECEPGKRYVSTVTGGGLNVRVETTLEPVENGTLVTLTWKGTGDAMLMKLLMPLSRGRIVRGAETDLYTFKKLIEGKGVRFY